jgi:ring-1,2-phenylacetyl-CoA epoxidase subunit PaaD
MVIEKDIWIALEAVMDPEIPVLSVVDLGIITDVSMDGSRASVKMTPTFSGCPAIKLMEKQVHDAVKALGFEEVAVETNFDVQWNTDRISAKGKEIIKNFGLAPPPQHNGNIDMNQLAHTKCPHCDSENTTMKSPFGPTLCRSLHYCFDCLQAFEAFKPI